MHRIALILASAVLFVAGCGSSTPAPKSSTDLPADSHDAVGNGSPDSLNSTATGQSVAPKEEQKNDKADETKKPESK